MLQKLFKNFDLDVQYLQMDATELINSKYAKYTKEFFNTDVLRYIPRIKTNSNFIIFCTDKVFVSAKDIIPIKDKIYELAKDMPGSDAVSLYSLSGYGMVPAKWPYLISSNKSKHSSVLEDLITKFVKLIRPNFKPISLNKGSFPGLPIVEGDKDYIITKMDNFIHAANNLDEIIRLYRKKRWVDLYKYHKFIMISRIGYRWQPDGGIDVNKPKKRMVMSLKDTLMNNTRGAFEANKKLPDNLKGFAGKLRTYQGLNSMPNNIIQCIISPYRTGLSELSELFHIRDNNQLEGWVNFDRSNKVYTLDIKEYDNNINPVTIAHLINSLDVNDDAKDFLAWSLLSPVYMSDVYPDSKNLDRIFGCPFDEKGHFFGSLKSGNAQTDFIGTVITFLCNLVPYIKAGVPFSFFIRMIHSETKTKVTAKGDNSILINNYDELYSVSLNKIFLDENLFMKFYINNHPFPVEFDSIPKFLGKLILKFDDGYKVINNEVTAFRNFISPEREYQKKFRRGAALGYFEKINIATYSQCLYETLEKFIQDKYHINMRIAITAEKDKFLKSIRDEFGRIPNLSDIDIEVINEPSLLSWKYDSNDVDPLVHSLIKTTVSEQLFSKVIKRFYK